MSSATSTKASVTIALGGMGEGKTHLIEYLVIDKLVNGGFNHVCVLTTTGFTGQWQSFLPRELVANYTGYGAQNSSKSAWDPVLAEFRNIQIRQCDVDPETDLPRAKPAPALLVIDDGNGRIPYGSDQWTEFISTIRHINTQVIIATQTLKKLPMNFYDYVTEMAIFKQNNVKYIKDIYDRIGNGGDCATWQEFGAKLKLATEKPHHYLLWKRYPKKLRDGEETDTEDEYVIQCAPENNGSMQVKFVLDDEEEEEQKNPNTLKEGPEKKKTSAKESDEEISKKKIKLEQ